MNGFDALIKCAGEWEGRNKVQTTETEPVEESASRLVVTPVLRIIREATPTARSGRACPAGTFSAGMYGAASCGDRRNTP